MEDDPKQVTFFRPPTTFKEFKKIVEDFSMQVLGKPSTVTDKRLREMWKTAQAKRKASIRAVNKSDPAN